MFLVKLCQFSKLKVPMVTKKIIRLKYNNGISYAILTATLQSQKRVICFLTNIQNIKTKTKPEILQGLAFISVEFIPKKGNHRHIWGLKFDLLFINWKRSFRGRKMLRSSNSALNTGFYFTLQ